MRFISRLTALLLSMFLLCGCSLTEEQPESPKTEFPGLIGQPDYPEYPPYPNDSMSYFGSSDEDAYEAWRDSFRVRAALASHQEELTPFLTASAAQVLSGSGVQNRIYSPLSLVMALAALAEATGGDTQAEVLALLGCSDIDAVRQLASDLWNANYVDDGTMTRTLATSLWLNETVAFRQETIQSLAKHHYAASYRGKIGSPEMNSALQKWLNDNTMGLLSDQVSGVTLPPDTVLALANTIAFSARWDSTFNPDANVQDVFHTPNGDVTCDFMRSSARSRLYWGENFQAVQRSFDMGGRMWLILPDEGVTTNDLLQDEECLALITQGLLPDSREMMIHLSLPKFDVSSQMELSGAIRALGVTEAFSPEADFSPLTGADIPVWLSQVRHDARVVIDEEGCKAAAYTVMILAGAAPPQEWEEIDFVLDRPFIFVITGANDLPLFVGVVNQP